MRTNRSGSLPHKEIKSVSPTKKQTAKKIYGRQEAALAETELHPSWKRQEPRRRYYTSPLQHRAHPLQRRAQSGQPCGLFFICHPERSRPQSSPPSFLELASYVNLRYTIPVKNHASPQARLPQIPKTQKS